MNQNKTEISDPQTGLSQANDLAHRHGGEKSPIWERDPELKRAIEETHDAVFGAAPCSPLSDEITEKEVLETLEVLGAMETWAKENWFKEGGLLSDTYDPLNSISDQNPNGVRHIPSRDEILKLRDQAIAEGRYSDLEIKTKTS